MRPFIIMLGALTFLPGCQTLSTAQAQGIHDNAAASASAAASLPATPQTAAIIDSQKAIAAAVGQPLTTTAPTVSP